MSNTYTPSAVELGNITIPDDGDGPIQAADVNVPLCALGDGMAFLASHLKLVAQVFTSSGPFVAPDDCDSAILIGCGGGGGGGGGGRGGNPANTADSYNCSGGGGGGAPVSTVAVAVTPGASYTVTIGAGGTAGTADTGTGAGNGGAGGDTIFGSLAYFPGGGGGRGGNVMGDASNYALAAGGTIKGWSDLPTTIGQTQGNLVVPTSGATFQIMRPPGTGGFGTTNHSALWTGFGLQSGEPSSFGGFQPGSVGATRGTDSGSLRGGGAGGGGGGGPFGAGADGGNGGNANGAGGGSSGANGSAAAANTGAGGGGGGGAGMGSSAVGNGGAGGAGGSGKLIVLRVAKG